MSARPSLLAVVALLAATNLACGAIPLPFSAPRPSSLQVTATYADGSALDVEQTLALPLERALLGVAGVAHVDTSCVEGVAILDARLAPGADPYAAAEAARERIRDSEGEFPAGVDPTLRVRPPVDRVTVLVSEVDPGPTSRTAAALAEAAARIAGVYEVSLVGQLVERTDIRLDGPRLLALGLTPREVRAALERPALDRALLDVRAEGPEELRDRPLNTDGLRLSDVATIDVNSAPVGRVYANGERAVVLRVDLNPASETAEAELAQLVATVPEAWIMTGARVFDVYGAEGSLDEVLSWLSDAPKPERGVTVRPEHGQAEFWTWGGTPEAEPGVTLRPRDGDRQSVIIRGEDREILDQVAEAFVARLTTEAGVGFVAARSSGRTPERRVEVDRDAAARLGMSASDVATALADASGQALQVPGSQWLIVDGFGSLEEPEGMMLPLRLAGAPQVVPLLTVARVQLVEGRANLTRRDGLPSVIVDADVDARRLKRILADTALPVGVSVELEAGGFR